jgi:gentisate 1,2-dioxygenase
LAEGGGFSIIGGQRYDWELGDSFVVPAWAWHEHASSQGEAVLFCFTNRPILQAFDREREEALESGYQNKKTRSSHGWMTHRPLWDTPY